MKSKSVIVIGADVGGITAALHLAIHGLYVTVLEKRCRSEYASRHRYPYGNGLCPLVSGRIMDDQMNSNNEKG